MPRPVPRMCLPHWEVMKCIERCLKIPLPSRQDGGSSARESLVCTGGKFFIGKADRCSIYMKKSSYCHPNRS